ncbi:MAG TPA: hypothetical protein VLL07_03020, partial [Pontiella sp.]|nr:hypothetical protein [Pontiella sp.]
MIKRIVWHGFFVVLMGLIFSGFLSEDSVLLTTDAAIKGSNVSPSEVIHRMPPHWNDRVLLGSPRGTGTQLASVLKAFTSGVVWNNLAYGLACLLSSWIFLRRFRSLTPWASVLGALAAFWVGTNFSIVLAGHYFKPYVILFFVCSLLPVSGAAAGSVGSALLWGACVGLMFAQQPDVALFFALFAGAYLVFLLWKEQGLKPAGWLKIMVPAAAMAFLFAAGPLLSGYEHHVKGTAQMKTENGQQKWEYVTQWSVPPDEMADLIAPGYYGWRSNEPDGPYWGRTGRSPGWENTKQGFRNFRLESIYIGMIPVSFALFSLFTFRRS